MLKILGRASSINVRKVLWTCNELDIDFEREDWGIGFQPTAQESFLALNPNAMIPVLIDGDFVLWESNTICRYLGTQYGDGTLLPIEPKTRAITEQWMDWQATELNNAWRYAFMALVRKSPAYQVPEQLQVSIAGWNRAMAILEGQLSATSRFITGDRFSLADIVLGLSVNRWMLAPIEHPHYPAIADYFERLHERPGFREFCGNGMP